MLVQELFDKFLKLEEQQEFFNIKIYDVYIWNYVRAYIYHTICERLEYGRGHEMADIIIRHKRSSFFKVFWQILHIGEIKNILKYMPFFLQKRDVLCVLFCERVKNGKYNEEKYVDKYYSQINRHTYYALEWSVGVSAPAASPQTKNLRYTCDDLIYTWFGKKNHIKYKEIYRQFYTLILEKVEAGLGFYFTKEEKKRIYQQIYLVYSRRNAYMTYYEFILKQICPKVILYYNINEYYTQFLVEVGKKHHIKTVELQHGVFERYIEHVYLPEQGGAVVPDYFLTFGACFDDFLAPKRVKTLNVGRPDVLLKVNQYKERNGNKTRKTILFISTVDGVVEYLQQVWEKIDYDKYKVILKLHPVELPFWKKKYPFLTDMEKVKVVGKTDRDIFYWINQADYIVGKGSTCFYEVLPFPVVKIFIDDTNRLVRLLTERGYALSIKEGETVIDVIEQVERGKLQINKFEQDNYIMYSRPMDRMDSVLEKIIMDGE